MIRRNTCFRDKRNCNTPNTIRHGCRDSRSTDDGPLVELVGAEGGGAEAHNPVVSVERHEGEAYFQLRRLVLVRAVRVSARVHVSVSIDRGVVALLASR